MEGVQCVSLRISVGDNSTEHTTPVPSLAASNLILLFVIIWMGTTMTGFGSTYTVPIQRTFDIAVYALFLTVFTVPMTVIVNRYVVPAPPHSLQCTTTQLRRSAITTPHKLPWFAPLRALQILLTPTEFYKPWKIYLAPGLIPARMIHVLWLVVVQRSVRSLLIPGLIPTDGSDGSGGSGDKPDADKWYNPFAHVSTFALIAYLLFVVLSSIFVLTPLEVMTTRLTIQVRTLDSTWIV